MTDELAESKGLNVVSKSKSRRAMVLGTGLVQCCGNPACARAITRHENEVSYSYDREDASLLTRQYNRFQAHNLGEGMAEYEQSIALMKRRLFGGLRGSEKEKLTIVELGIGAAPNFKYYGPGRVTKGDKYYGIDINPEMFDYAKESIANVERSYLQGVEGVAPFNVTYRLADVQSTGLPDAFADAVIGTLLLCSVEDQKATLAEIRRILKPGGKYYFIEHVGADLGTPLRFAQDVLNPLQQIVAGGCHLNRDTSLAIAQSFADGDITQYRFDVLPGKIRFDNGFELDNPEGANFNASLISPHISGEATAGDCILKRCPPKVTI